MLSVQGNGSGNGNVEANGAAIQPQTSIDLSLVLSPADLAKLTAGSVVIQGNDGKTIVLEYRSALGERTHIAAFETQEVVIKLWQPGNGEDRYAFLLITYLYSKFTTTINDTNQQRI